MWGLAESLGWRWEQQYPEVTVWAVVWLGLGLVGLRGLIQRVLWVYFQIRERGEQMPSTLEYSYFYHLSMVVLILGEVRWNMFDLAVWVVSYVGVGLIRRAIFVIRIERDMMLGDYSYNNKLMAVLSASKALAVLVFLLSLLYFLSVQVLFEGVAVRLTSLLLFPTLMLAVDCVFLLCSSLASEGEMLSYFNQNVNALPSSYRLEAV